MNGSRTASNAPVGHQDGWRGRLCFSRVRGKGVVRNICRIKKEEPTMATKKSLRVLVGICVISACVLGAAMQAGAETLNYKF